MRSSGQWCTITVFDDFADAIRQANDSPFGLNAGVFTESISNALFAVERAEYGSVYINDSPTTRVDHQPYGGVKDSGNTREGPRYAIDEMTEMRFVTFRSSR